MSNGVRDLLDQAGVTITAFRPIQPGATSYADVVREVAAADPDVIYAGTYYPEGALIARAMLAQRLDAKCVADYGSDDTGYIEDAGLKAARSCPVIGVPAPNEVPRAKRFVAAYRKAYGTEPGTWSPYTFDSVNLLAEVAEETGGFDAVKITEALNAVDGTEGWTGSITLEAGSGNRDPGTVVLLEILHDRPPRPGRCRARCCWRPTRSCAGAATRSATASPRRCCSAPTCSSPSTTCTC